MPSDSPAASASLNRTLLAVCAGTLCLGSALLFTIQPLMGRLLLPLAGGAPAVWTTCLMFFQAALLLGYLYAHLSSRWLDMRTQQWVHAIVLLVPLAGLPAYASAAWGTPDPSQPIPWLIARLLRSIGLPFVVLAATAPLVQRWFAATKHPRASDPFFLYAASNIGSFAGLLAYPFLIEPSLTLAQQGAAWTIGYVVLVVMAWISVALARRDLATPAAEGSDRRHDATAPDSLATAQRLRWLGLSFVPSLLMLSVTTHISTDIAAVPLLWIAPLALYLATFVLTFAERRRVPHRMMTTVLAIAVIPPAILMTQAGVSPLVAIPLHLFALFATGMVCHGELVRQRPAAQHLTGFYLWIATGGVAGGFFASVLAPLLFRTPLEYPLALVLACLCRPRPEPRPSSHQILDFGAPIAVAIFLVVQMTVARQAQLVPTALSTIALVLMPAIVVCAVVWNRPRSFAAGIALVLAAAITWHRVNTRTEHIERNFFGVQSVELSSRGGFRALVHGNTIHGTQALNPAVRREPTSYYTRTGPAGQVLSSTPSAVDGTRARVAVVGLGAGTLASYARPSESWTFYEINPAVERLAKDPSFFTYLSDCGSSCSVVLGDARLALARASGPPYDVIVLDAFSSDAVPVHLLTREAMALYLRALAPRGVLLVHLSNRFLDLRPVVASLAADAGLVAFSRSDNGPPRSDDGPGRIDSVWAVAARHRDDFGSIVQDPRWRLLEPAPGMRVWTDDFSNIVALLRRLP